MTPDKWMAKAGFTNYSLAKAWGMASSSIWRQLTGKREPSFDMMVRFHVASGGEVRLEDWIKLVKPNLKALGAKRIKLNGG